MWGQGGYKSEDLRLAIEWLDIIRNKPDRLLRCTSCDEEWAAHINEKCLFGPTHFAALQRLTWAGPLHKAVLAMADVMAVFAAAGYKRHYRMAQTLSEELHLRCDHSGKVSTEWNPQGNTHQLVKCHDCGWPWEEETA